MSVRSLVRWRHRIGRAPMRSSYADVFERRAATGNGAFMCNRLNIPSDRPWIFEQQICLKIEQFKRLSLYLTRNKIDKSTVFYHLRIPTLSSNAKEPLCTHSTHAIDPVFDRRSWRTTQDHDQCKQTNHASIDAYVRPVKRSQSSVHVSIKS